MDNNADYNQGYQDGIDSMRSKLQTMIDTQLQEMVEQNEEFPHGDEYHSMTDDIMTGWVECLEMYQLAIPKIK
tara:strand:+ start:106 stop:324 length:219 start_codon:yes stop_codon:yes gene_type:complete